jgi:NAD-dependent dihydropyrimidine dehydrogenase PreA subunit/nitroreductase
MIIIDQKKCNNCGLCTQICHESCMFIENNILKINYEYCSTCTQCIAICPKQALTWDNFKSESYNKSLYPDSVQIDELLKERRTIRDFTNKKIDRALLEEIASYAIYAPTHDFNLRVIIIDDESLLKQIDTLILDFSVNLFNWVYKPKFVHLLIKLFMPNFEFEYRKAKPKLENAKKRNRGFKSKPAAIIMIIGNKRIPLSLESAQYALYNIDLYAQTKGLACRNLVGNQMILNGNRKFRQSIGLNKKERICGTLLMGYPAIKFRNKVNGKKIKIDWNTIKN